jgi:hypothetical protein
LNPKNGSQKEILAKQSGGLRSRKMNVATQTSNSIRHTAVLARFSSPLTRHFLLHPLFSSASGPANGSFNDLHPKATP